MPVSTVSAEAAIFRFPTGSRLARVFWFLALFLGMTLIIAHIAITAVDESDPNSPAFIRSGAEIDYPPFSIVDEKGRAGGFSVELMKAALAAMGREVTFRTGPWAEVRGWLECGEIDALPLVERTPEREPLFDCTVPYMSLHGAIVVRGDETGIRDFSDLRGRRVAVMKGDNAEEFLRRQKHNFEIRTTSTFEIALRELAEGWHDAVVIQRLVAGTDGSSEDRKDRCDAGHVLFARRNLNFDFTQAHIVSHYVAVVRKGEDPAPENIDALKGKRIVVENGDILNDYTLETGLAEQISTVEDQEEALRQPADGMHECALMARATALYLIDKNGWTNLIPGKKTAPDIRVRLRGGQRTESTADPVR